MSDQDDQINFDPKLDKKQNYHLKNNSGDDDSVLRETVVEKPKQVEKDEEVQNDDGSGFTDKEREALSIVQEPSKPRTKSQILRNYKFNKFPRHLPSGDVVFPFSTAWVLKRVEKFNSKDAELKIIATIILRVKITGYEDNQEVVEHLMKNQQIRINESSFKLVDLGVKPKKTKSSNAQDGKNDMVQYTIRLDTTAYVDLQEYVNYPFDQLHCLIKIDMTHFKAKVDDTFTDFRFDYYKQEDELSWKTNVDGLPENDIDFKSAKIKALKEIKEGNEDDEPIVYYPGYTLCFKICRNPVQAVMMFLFPALILGVFIGGATQCDEIADVLASVSLATLALISLYQGVRSNLPAIPLISFAEKIILINLLYSLVPVGQFFHVKNGGKKPQPSTDFTIYCLVQGAIILFISYKWIRQTHVIHQIVPIQTKTKSDKEGVDASWTPPQ